MRRALLQIGLVLLGVAGFLALLLWLNPTLLDRLRGQERYLLPLAEVDCPAPAGMTRADFLDEVQYYGSLPERIDLLDESMGEKLKEAFSRHPWVRGVKAIQSIPPRGVKAELTFRKAVLAVRTGKALRAVDEQGVLLPKNAGVKGLPVLEQEAEAPKGAEGTPWGDARVEEAARQAGARGALDK